MQETWAQSLGWKDPLEREMATHSSILAWRIPRTEEPGRLQTMGSQRVGHDWACITCSFYNSLSMSPIIQIVCMHAKSLQLCPTLYDLWTGAHQGPLSLGFSRQENWSGLPCPPPGDLQNPGIKPRSPTLQADSLPSELPGKPKTYL